MEVKEKVKYIEVDMVCDSCGDGRMRPTATVLKEYPPKYIHECDNCGSTGIYKVRYPYKANEKRKRIDE